MFSGGKKKWSLLRDHVKLEPVSVKKNSVYARNDRNDGKLSAIDESPPSSPIQGSAHIDADHPTTPSSLAGKMEVIPELSLAANVKHVVSRKHNMIKEFGVGVNSYNTPMLLNELQEINNDTTAYSIGEDIINLTKSHMFHPCSMRMETWKFFVVTLVIYSATMIPFRIGFRSDAMGGFLIFDVIVDCFFFIDLLVTFNTGIMDEKAGRIITDRGVVCETYLKGWFLIDFISAFPFDRIIESTSSAARTSKLFRFLKIARASKARLLSIFLRKVDVNPVSIAVIFIFLRVIFFSHIAACLWHFMGTDEYFTSQGETWLDYESLTDSNLKTRFINSLYWAVTTIMTVGYGDITATTTSERIYCMIIQLLGAMLFGTLIAKVGELVATSDPTANACKERLNELRQYVSCSQISRALRTNAIEDLNYYMAQKSPFDESILLSDLPVSQSQALLSSSYSPIAYSIKILRASEDSDFVTFIASHLVPISVKHGVEIMAEGDIPNEIAFIGRGTVSMVTYESQRTKSSEFNNLRPGAPWFRKLFASRRVTPINCEDEDEEKAHVNNLKCKSSKIPVIVSYSTSGDLFGEYEFVRRVPRVARYVSVTPCQIYCLSRDVMEEARDKYPTAARNFSTLLYSRCSLIQQVLKNAILKKDSIYYRERCLLDGEVAPIENLLGSSNVAGYAQQQAEVDIICVKLPSTAVPNKVYRRKSAVSSHKSADETLDEKSRRLKEIISWWWNESKKKKSKYKVKGDWTVFDAPRTIIGEKHLIDPAGNGKFKWDMLVGILILQSAFIVPYTVAFSTESSSGQEIADYIIDVLFLLDMIVTTRTAIRDPSDGVLVIDSYQIMMTYLSSNWFLVDLASVFPFEEVILLISGGGSSGSSLSLARLFRLLRLAKLLRIMRLRNLLSTLENLFQIDDNIKDCIKTIANVSFIAHLLACVWIGTSIGSTKEDNSWYGQIDLQDSENYHIYIASLYWTLTTVMTVGYGDIVPISNSEKICACLIMLLGTTVFGYVLAVVSSLLLNEDSSAAKDGKIKLLSNYLDSKFVTPVMKDSALKHVKFLHAETNQVDEDKLLSCLSPACRRDIIYNKYIHAIKTILPLKFSLQKGVCVYLFSCMDPELFDSGQFLFEEGSHGRKIFFIVSGTCEIVQKVRPDSPTRQSKKNVIVPDNEDDDDDEVEKLNDDEVVHDEILPGNFVGHVALLDGKKNKFGVRAKCKCATFSLSSKALNHISQEYPAVLIHLQQVLGKSICQQNEMMSQRASTAFNNLMWRKRENCKKSKGVFSMIRLSVSLAQSITQSPRKRVESVGLLKESSLSPKKLSFARIGIVSMFKPMLRHHSLSVESLKRNQSQTKIKKALSFPGSRSESKSHKRSRQKENDKAIRPYEV